MEKCKRLFETGKKVLLLSRKPRFSSLFQETHLCVCVCVWMSSSFFVLFFYHFYVRAIFSSPFTFYLPDSPHRFSKYISRYISESIHNCWGKKLKSKENNLIEKGKLPVSCLTCQVYSKRSPTEIISQNEFI